MKEKLFSSICKHKYAKYNSFQLAKDYNIHLTESQFTSENKYFLHTTMVDVIDDQGLQLVCLGVLRSSK